jgi:hypothetical protein
LQAASAYSRTLTLATLALLAGVMTLNWLVNPFSLFDPPTIRGINATKPGYIEHLRLTHAHRVASMRPDCILLGTSRTGRGLRPDHPALTQFDCYNLALPAISMYEIRRYLQHANAVAPIALAIVSIDFRVMNTAADRSGAFVEARLAVDENGARQRNPLAAWAPDMVASLLSISAIEASIDTVRRQSWVKDTLRRDGLWAQIDDHYDHAAGFEAYTRNTLRRYSEAASLDNVFRDNLAHYRLMLRDAHAANIDLRLLIPPSHAWHWQSLRVSGLWPRFEAMKQRLIEINDEEARRASRVPFTIHDFSGSWGPALEAVPTTPSAKMQWFWEPVHFKTTLGDLLIAQVMDAPGPHPALASLPFDTRLAATTLAAHHARLRTLQDDFEQQQPDVSDHIRALQHEVPR